MRYDDFPFYETVACLNGFHVVKFSHACSVSQPKKGDDNGVKGQEIASSAAVSQNGVESKSQSKKRKRMFKENGRFTVCGGLGLQNE